MVTEKFLREHGFLPSDDGEGDEFGWSIWDKTDAELDPEHDEEKPHHGLVYKLNDQTLWLEAYNASGHTLAITQLPCLHPDDIKILLTLLTHQKD